MKAAGCWTVQAAAAQAVELVDILVRAAGGTVVVVDVATSSYLDEAYRQWKPSRIAAEQATRCGVHEFGGLAAGAVGLGEEALVIPGAGPAGFLEGWAPYELTLVGLPVVPTAEQVDEIRLEVGSVRRDRPILPRLGGCRLWCSGHDECHAWMESTDRGVPLAVLGRLPALLVGSALIDTGGHPFRLTPFTTDVVA